MKAAKHYVKTVFVISLQILRRMDYILLYLLYSCFCRMDEKQIVMLSDSRESLSGNLAFIDAEIPKDEYTVLYFFKKNLEEKKKFSEKKAMCKAMAASKYILLDDFYPLIYPIPISKKTKVIQVWHAMGAFKQVGFSRLGKAGGPSSKYSLSHRNYTDAIVSSEAIRKNYAEAFKMNVEDVHALGVPRTDIFFDKKYGQEMRESIYGKYPQLQGKKVILFAPTFRGNGQKSAFYPFEEWLDFAKLREELKEEYVFLFKPHPFTHNRPEEALPEDFYIDCSDYREINDLLFVTDVLVTDYSSVIFEASLLDLKTVFYVPDMEEYVESRDFYYPFEEYAFGIVAERKEDLVAAIRAPWQPDGKLEAFREKFCSACDGRSSKRFVEEFFMR